MKKYIIVISIFALFACKNEVAEKPVENYTPQRTEANVAAMNDSLPVLVAKNIIYDVVVNAPDSINEWQLKCLEGMDIRAIADAIFQQIYNERLIAYDYISGKQLSIEEVKKLEIEKPRNTIGNIQFIENWYFDDTNLQFGKQVSGIMLAYERYEDDGSVKESYSPGVVVYFGQH